MSSSTCVSGQQFNVDDANILKTMEVNVAVDKLDNGESLYELL